MIELSQYKRQLLNAKDRITIDLIKQGEEFIKEFDVNHGLLIDTVTIIYKYLKNIDRFPQNLFKFYIAAFYISERHPKAFPKHEKRENFCRKFGMKQSALEYSVKKIVSTLGFLTIFDDMNYPYYIDPKNDIGYKLMKNVVKKGTDKAIMDFLLNKNPVNSQILAEDLTSQVILKMSLFPEELFRQFFNLIFEMVEDQLQELYYNYIELQNKYFI
ncbi:MAG: hypothetical protein EU541_04095 [Promethearchaeota archaeon]|nr:MAG: hypothetical protein EU541_04095 [Candidatus Lokiarchaeota archaeon]